MIERYKKVHNLKKNIEVAERMEISDSALSNQIRRNSLDYRKLLRSCDEGVNLHWILTGEGSRWISEPIQKDELLERQFSDYEDSLDELSKSNISRDEMLEFLLTQQEAVLSFLHKLRGESDGQTGDH